MAKTITYGDKANLNVLTGVNAVNKVSDTDMNEIKDTVNSTIEGIGFDSDTYSNTSTYAVGDMVIYNNAIYKCNTAIAVGENFDSSKWDLIPLSQAITRPKSCMRMYLSSQYSYTSNAAKKLTLTKDSSQGSNLTVSDGGVKIGAGISHVFVSGQVYFFTGSNHADGKLCLLYKNNTVISATHNRQSYNYIMTTGSCIIPVSEGDVIYLYCQNDTSSTTVIQNGKQYTYLNVVEI